MPDPRAVQEGPLRFPQKIPVVIEYELGDKKRGLDANGKAWVRIYGYRSDGSHVPGFVGYGCIPRTCSGDGEDLDVYLGDDIENEIAYLIEQGEPDPEHKLMLGWPSQEAALACYLAHIPASMLVGIMPVPIALIQALVGAPVAKNAEVGSLVKKIVSALRAASPPEITKAEKQKRRSTALLLMEVGPPDEWSGAVAAILGARKDDVIALWEALSADQKDAARAAWKAFFDAESFAMDLEDETPALAKRGDSPRVQKAAQEAGAALIIKSAGDELRYVLGIVLEPLDPARGEADTQGDAYSADEIRKAAWFHLIHFRNVSYEHGAFLNGKVFLVESWIAPHDMVIEGSQIRAGTWLAGFYVPDDEVWAMVKSGELNALSIGGTAKRTPIAA